MSEVRIYKLDLSVASFNFATASPPETYFSSAWGGTNTPLVGNPELAELENVKTVVGGGAAGQTVIDASDAADYTSSWVTMAGVGPLANGQFDVRGGGPGKPLKCRWNQFFKSSALNEAGFSNPLILTNGGAAGTSSGLFSTIFLGLEMNQTAGAAFDWNLRFNEPTGADTSHMRNFGGPSDTADDAEHTLIVTMTPSSVTDTLDWTTVGADGEITVEKDGVVIISATGIRFMVNQLASGDAFFYGKTIWHGD